MLEQEHKKKDDFAPTAIIAGSPKCGTSSLFRYLGDHPQVCPASVEETYFLIDRGYPLFDAACNVEKQGIGGYRQFFGQFDSSQHLLRLEATPDYLYQRTPLQRIGEFAQKPHIIFILRKPSARIYSLFRFAQQNIAKLDPRMTFSQFVTKVRVGDFPATMGIVRNALAHSRYIDYLPEWYRALGEDHIHVYIFDHMVADPQKFMRTVASDLSIPAAYYDTYRFEAQNTTAKFRSQWLRRFEVRYGLRIRSLPMGGLVRTLYRAANRTAVRPEMDAVDRDMMKQLDKEFEQANEALGTLTGIDMAGWGPSD